MQTKKFCPLLAKILGLVANFTVEGCFSARKQAMKIFLSFNQAKNWSA
jgi:hypothetical protein